MNPIFTAVLTAAAILVGMAASLEVGFRVGRRRAATPREERGSQLGAIQGAVLGLLGLLLAFSFAGAATRFMERQDLIVEEANAIGTSFLRADLLEEPQRSELRAALKAYTEHRIGVSTNLSHGVDLSALAEVDRLHARIWRAARDGVARAPQLAVPVLTPINEVIDLHTLRINAGRKHLPWLVTTLLVACSLLAVATIGLGCGMEGRRLSPLTWSLVLLISSTLWITYDLDHPRMGLLQLSDVALRELKFDPQ
jgi:hypothetical protein